MRLALWVALALVAGCSEPTAAPAPAPAPDEPPAPPVVASGLGGDCTSGWQIDPLGNCRIILAPLDDLVHLETPSVAVHPDGRIAVAVVGVWVHHGMPSQPNGGRHVVLHLYVSNDRGDHWTAQELPVQDWARHHEADDHHVEIASIAWVDDKLVLAVGYSDKGGVVVAIERFAELIFASSSDDGATWQTEVIDDTLGLVAPLHVGVHNGTPWIVAFGDGIARFWWNDGAWRQARLAGCDLFDDYLVPRPDIASLPWGTVPCHSQLAQVDPDNGTVARTWLPEEFLWVARNGPGHHLGINPEYAGGGHIGVWREDEWLLRPTSAYEHLRLGDWYEGFTVEALVAAPADHFLVVGSSGGNEIHEYAEGYPFAVLLGPTGQWIETRPLATIGVQEYHDRPPSLVLYNDGTCTAAHQALVVACVQSGRLELFRFGLD